MNKKLPKLDLKYYISILTIGSLGTFMGATHSTRRGLEYWIITLIVVILLTLIISNFKVVRK